MGGWIAWMTAAAAPERVPAIVASGAWDPRPEPEPTEPDDWLEALRRGGTRALVDLFRAHDGESFDREFPPTAGSRDDLKRVQRNRVWTGTLASTPAR